MSGPHAVKNQLAAISLVFFLQFFGYGAVEPFLSFYASDFLSVFQISMLVSTIYASFALSTLLSGKIVEQYGTVRSIRLGAILYAPLPFMLAFSRNFWQLFAAAAFVGLGASILWNGGKTFVFRNSLTRGAAYGKFNGVSRLGSALAGLGGGWLAAVHGMTNIFLLAGISILCATAATFLLADAKDSRIRYPLAEQWRMFRDSDLLRLAAVMFLGTLFAGVSSPLTPLVVKSLGGGAFEVGLVPFFSALLAAAAMVYAGKLSDSIGRKPVLAGSLLVGAISSLALFAAADYWVVLVAVALYALSWAAALVVIAASVSDLFKEKLSLALVVTSSAASAGTSAGAFLAGTLSFEGLRFPFLALGLLLLLSPLVVRGVKTR